MDASNSLIVPYTVMGAQYMTLPKNLPPGSNTKDGSSTEGLFWLVWGEGHWVSNLAAEPAFVVSGISGLHRKRKKELDECS